MNGLFRIARVIRDLVLEALTIAAIIVGAAGIYYFVVRWESLPVGIAILAMFLFVIGLLVGW